MRDLFLAFWDLGNVLFSAIFLDFFVQKIYRCYPKCYFAIFLKHNIFSTQNPSIKYCAFGILVFFYQIKNIFLRLQWKVTSLSNSNIFAWFAKFFICDKMHSGMHFQNQWNLVEILPLCTHIQLLYKIVGLLKKN